MASVQPLRALYPDQAAAGQMQALASPPYDVIDDAQREELAARSPHNAVHVDLPRAPGGGDPYAHAAGLLRAWEAEGALVRDARPALWPLRQDYTGPDGRARRREGFLARVRVELYGPGRIRAHERTHPGPKEDRLRLTRATRANLSPIFALFSDPEGASRTALEPATRGEPFAQVIDEQGTTHRLWRAADPQAIEAVVAATAPAELLIADGHHRYETARAYADEVGDHEGPHRWVLMCLVALEDPGLTVFPTHRLVRDTTPHQQEALADALRRDFDLEEVALDDLVPPAGDGPPVFGYLDAQSKRALRATLKDPAIVESALPSASAAYRALDTAVLEALLLAGPLELTQERIAHLDGLGYARDDEEARDLVLGGAYDLCFFLRPTPMNQVRAVAAEGVTMPPKSTFFFPKVPTGLLFHSLEDRE
ncbi:MAG: DUF1015 domain-containing protein [Solirubrobacteraceae bacterium MAG38_C4-C5]|nr:DUF1015 domain-containing protein [Candidatus Siliceabacter maunaloa]